MNKLSPFSPTITQSCPAGTVKDIFLRTCCSECGYVKQTDLKRVQHSPHTDSRQAYLNSIDIPSLSANCSSGYGISPLVMVGRMSKAPYNPKISRVMPESRLELPRRLSTEFSTESDACCIRNSEDKLRLSSDRILRYANRSCPECQIKR